MTKHKTLEQKTKRELIREADKWFSRYVRLRDAKYIDGQWIGECIDECNRKIIVINFEGKWQKASNIGHFITRGHMVLRYDELNCNLQSSFCNAWRDKYSMLLGYRKGLDLKYGEGTWEGLVAKGNDIYKITKEELLDIIHDSKTYVEHCLTHPENYE